jgi:FMN-dependent NADH-azoreductase
MKLLYVTANPKPDAQSACKSVAGRFIDRFAQLHPNLIVERLDLYAEDIPSVDFSIYDGRGHIREVRPAADVYLPLLGDHDYLA